MIYFTLYKIRSIGFRAMSLILKHQKRIEFLTNLHVMNEKLSL